MKLLSICVGLLREIDWKGKPVRTSIFKTPVTGRIPVTKLNLKGDQQSDLSVHGGIDKVVYAYPSEHYAFWREQLPRVDLPWGAFGENFTTDSRNLVSATPAGESPSRNIDVAIGHAHQTRGPWHEVRTKT